MRCNGCLYYRHLVKPGSKYGKCCHYLIDTGKMRKIPSAECYKHEGTPYKKGTYQYDRNEWEKRSI